MDEGEKMVLGEMPGEGHPFVFFGPAETISSPAVPERDEGDQTANYGWRERDDALDQVQALL